MGRHKTPTSILESRGSWRAKSRRKTEPEPPPGIPKLALDLSGKGKEIWDDLSERLVDLGVLSEIDGGALARYCDLWVKWEMLSAVDVDTMDLSEAAERRHARTLRQLSGHLLQIEKEYGMTPSSRSNVTVSQKPAHGNSKHKSRWIDMHEVRRGK